ncbi:MAG: hypothetical protein D8M58_11950 [Calditrichaeota bacterium]|nr:MAG: hypothetical protein DWQ03_12735 [Calditrichota bacterium]MBL1206109.1 hypothetical protein [Calditrichota bacterium]NOG45934.1 hypothetical protein [Calditrichota bacterium]
MKNFISTFMLIFIISSVSVAAERKELKDVNTDEFTKDTQVSPKGGGDSHVSFAWWVPTEFWESILSRDESIREADKSAMLATMSGVSLLAIVQGDVSQFGAFNFYTKEEIEKHMKISFSKEDGSQLEFEPMTSINPDLEVVLGVFKPILGNAMGNMGKSMHFYVLHDETDSGTRLLDPYEKGNIVVELSKRDDTVLTANIELPLNCLFIPRKCPNGKNAHISWNYCPWTGEKLEE